MEPRTAIMENQINISGPNNLPIESVPNCCKKKRANMMANTIYTMVDWGLDCSPGICFRPSIADGTEMGGVITPSASKAAPPIMAGKTSHLFWRLTSVYNENIPPSPLLSALSVSQTYLTVV